MLRIIAGKFKGRRLDTPNGSSTRPTQEILREALFNICQLYIEGASVLDLYAGSGSVGLEALSRGACHATFVESHRNAIICIKKNIALLEVQKQTTLLAKSAEMALSKMAGTFDIVYIDPPYDVAAGPILRELEAKNLLNPGAFVFLEERFSLKGKPPATSKLQLLKSRRFGPAVLHEYRESPHN